MTRRSLILLAGLLLTVAVGAAPAGAAEGGAECPDGTSIQVQQFTSDEAGTQVTAAFTVPAACQDVTITLAVYALGPGGQQAKLHDSTSGSFDGGSGTEQLTTGGPGCNLAVYLVAGQTEDDPGDYAEGDIVSVGSDDTFGQCAGFEPVTSTTTPPAEDAATLPFTGTGLGRPLLAGGLALVAAGAAGLASGRRGRRVARR